MAGCRRLCKRGVTIRQVTKGVVNLILRNVSYTALLVAL